MKKILALAIAVLFGTAATAQGDCPGVLICANTTASVVNGSNDTELSLAYSGCLPTGEAASKSIWYQFCVVTTGTLQFTINPAGAVNDFDWALWGPNSACPPTTAPLRCSYAAVSGGSDKTGVSSANNAPQTDNTEGAGGNQWVQDMNVTAGQCFVLLINNYGPGSNTFNISFGGTTTIFCSALTIELLYFTGEIAPAGNLLKWETASETNNSYFTVDRSINGYDWEAVATVVGAGTSSARLTYSFLDETFRNGEINYYRLSQTDFDGMLQQFDVIAIRNQQQDREIIKIISITGQEVPADYEGLRIIYYSDGTVIKKIGK